MRLNPALLLGICLALPACEGPNDRGPGPDLEVDETGSTSLYVGNRTSKALVVEIDRGDPWVEPQVETTAVPAGQVTHIITDSTIGGWLQPSEVLDRITIRRESDGEIVHAQEPIVDAEWSLEAGSTWQASSYTLVIGQ